MQWIRSICWMASLAGCSFGVIQLFDIVSYKSASAPQQAAGAAVALGFAVIPYCFARTVEKLLPPE